MASAMLGDHVEFVPLRSGPFQGRFRQVDLDGFVLRRIVHAPFLIHGAVRPDYVVLQLVVRPDGDLTLNGDALSASTLAVMPKAPAIQALCSADQDRIGLIFRAEVFDRLIEICSAQAFPRGAHQMQTLREDQASTMARVFAGMTDLAESLFAIPGFDKALTEECNRLLIGVLSSEDSRWEPPRRQTKSMLRQVSAADEFLRAHIDRPIYTEEICAALGTSARALHQSFGAVYGVSPHSYLKRRRLELVRRALRSLAAAPGIGEVRCSLARLLAPGPLQPGIHGDVRRDAFRDPR